MFERTFLRMRSASVERRARARALALGFRPNEELEALPMNVPDPTVDDSVSEAPHAIAKRIYDICKAAKPPFVFVTAYMPQNLTDTLGEPWSSADVDTEWQRHTSLLHAIENDHINSRPKQLKLKAFERAFCRPV